MKVLFDTNVIVDVLQSREPWREDAEQLFLFAAQRLIVGCITAKEATDIHYLSRKTFRGKAHSDRLARNVLQSLFDIFEVLDTCSYDCIDAIMSDCPDYEDAVMIQTAIRSGVDCIVTRNPKDYTMASIPVYSPVELVAALNG